MQAPRPLLLTAVLLAQCSSGFALRCPTALPVRAAGAAQPSSTQTWAAARVAPAVRHSNIVMSEPKSSSKSFAVAALAIWLGTHLLPLLLQVAPVSAAEVGGAGPSPVSSEDQLYFNAIAFVGGPLTLASGAFFRVINGREQPDFEQACQ